MKKQNKIILGALVVLLGVAIAFWPRKNAPLGSVRPTQTSGQSLGAATTVPSVPSAAGQSQPKAIPSAASPQKKFADMDGLERNAIRREIAKQDLPAIFQAMIDAGSVEHDPLKQMGLQTTLAGALREKKPSPGFLEQMRAFATNSSNSNFERQLLIGALESASTKETIALLGQIAGSSSEQKIRESAGSLAGVGDLGRGGAELSPGLEQVWRESSNSNQLFSAASSMAKIGTPSGIDLLLSAALATDGRDKARRDAAQHALQEIYLPNAVPLLADRLSSQPPTSATAELIAPVLVKIGDTTAGKVVVEWLTGRSENATPLIQDLIRQRTLGEPMLSMWNAALNPSVPFRNEQNREAIRAGLATYRAGRTTLP